MNVLHYLEEVGYFIKVNEKFFKHGRLMTKEQIENTFTYHKPKNDQPERYERIRSKARELANLILEDVPVSREQSIAFTKLQEVVMFANAGIAINE